MAEVKDGSFPTIAMTIGQFLRGFPLSRPVSTNSLLWVLKSFLWFGMPINPLKLGVSLHWYKIQTYQVLGQISRWCRNEVTGPKIDLVVLGYYGCFKFSPVGWFQGWPSESPVTIPCCSRAQLYVACSGARKMEHGKLTWRVLPVHMRCHWLSVEVMQPKWVIIYPISKEVRMKGNNHNQ